MKKLFLTFLLLLVAVCSFSQTKKVLGGDFELERTAYLLSFKSDLSDAVQCKPGVTCRITQQDFDSAGKIVEIFMIMDGKETSVGRWSSNKGIRVTQVKHENGLYSYVISDNNFMFATLLNAEEKGYVVIIDTQELK